MGNIDSSYSCAEQVLHLLPLVSVKETGVCEGYAHVIAEET